MNSKLMRKIYLLAILASLLSSCSKVDFAGMFMASSPAANERFADSRKLNPSSDIIATLSANSEDYLVYLFSDLHVYNTTTNLDLMTDAFGKDGRDIVMTLSLGDMNAGKDQYQLVTDHLKAFGNNLFLTAGNHDLYWGEWNNYLKWYGSSSYLIEVVTPSGKRDLYISVDSSGGDVGWDQMAWLKDTVFGKTLAGKNYRNIIVFTHCCIFVKNVISGVTGTLPTEEQYEIARLFSDNSVDLVLTGHHHFEEETVFSDVRYVVHDPLKDGLENAAYYIYHIGGSISSERIPLAR